MDIADCNEWRNGGLVEYVVFAQKGSHYAKNVIYCGEKIVFTHARVVELVDTRDLKSLGLTAVRVQVPLCAPVRPYSNPYIEKNQCRGFWLEIF